MDRLEQLYGPVPLAVEICQMPGGRAGLPGASAVERVAPLACSNTDGCQSMALCRIHCRLTAPGTGSWPSGHARRLVKPAA